MESTSPINLACPKEIDHITQKLIDAMKPFGVFEDEEELNHDAYVIKKCKVFYRHSLIITSINIYSCGLMMSYVGI